MSLGSQGVSDKEVTDEASALKASVHTSVTKTDGTNDTKMTTNLLTVKSPKSKRQPPCSLLVTGASANISNSSNNFLTPCSYYSSETGTKYKDKSHLSLKKNKSPSNRNYSTIKKSKSKSESDAYNNSQTPSTRSLESASSKSKELTTDDVFEGAYGFTYTPTSQSTPSHSKNSGNDSKKTSRSKGTPKTPRKSPKPFEHYLPLEEVQRGLKKGELIEGVLRINPKNFEDSYISAPDGQMDIYIGGILDRNRAMNGDLVAVQLHPSNRWKILFDNVRDYESKFHCSPSKSQGLCSLTKSSSLSSAVQGQTEANLLQNINTDQVLSETKKNQKKRSKKKKNTFECSGGDENCCSSNTEKKNCDTPGNCHSSTTDAIGKHCKKKKKNRRKRKKTEIEDSVTDILKKNSMNTDAEELSSDLQVLNISTSINRFLECNEFPLRDDNVAVPLTDHNVANEDEILDSVCQVVAPHELSEAEEIETADEQSVCSNEMEQHIEVFEFLEHSTTHECSELPQEFHENNENIPTEKKIDFRDENDSKINHDLLFDTLIKKSDSSIEKILENEFSTSLSIEKLNKKALSIEELLKHPKATKFVQKTGKVVYIIECKHTRMAVGSLKLMQDKNKDWALFAPHDHRIPRIMVPVTDCPKGFFERPQDFSKMIFIGRLTEWKNTGLAKGRIYRSLGEAGEIVPETEGILLQNNIDFTEFPDDILDGLPDCQSWKIPESELSYRKDLRKECIFTIDPVTARDLDDAVSCRKLTDGTFEIGVHIADVSFFVNENSPLDTVAAKRATSVYLVHMVVPMLPRLLCENLCSLNPSEERLCMSVIWNITEEGDILSEWFGRSIINSCAKLSYNDVQTMIENPTEHFNPKEYPPIYGGFTINDIVERVHQLNKIAVNLRKQRFENGSLRLDQVTLQFVLDEKSGLPVAFSPYELKDSNRLIEEFMLLANMSVAHKILKTYPKTALLRCHEPPQANMMEEVVDMCAKVGIHIDISSSKTIQDCLNRLNTTDALENAYFAVLTNLLSKPMKRAKYFCSGFIEDQTLYFHYALSVPLYTHFTSPIRRYPDILVHRSLAAALGYSPETMHPPKAIQTVAEHCNDKKYVAKLVQEYSQDMFLALFIKECGSREETAIVTSVLDHSFDVLVLRLGIIRRVYCDQLPLKNIKFCRDQGICRLILVWNTDKNEETTQIITIFSLVQVLLVPGSDALKFNVLLKHP